MGILKCSNFFPNLCEIWRIWRKIKQNLGEFYAILLNFLFYPFFITLGIITF